MIRKSVLSGSVYKENERRTGSWGRAARTMAGCQSAALILRIFGTEGPKRSADRTWGLKPIVITDPTSTTSNAGGNATAA